VLEPTGPGWALRDVSANGTWSDGLRLDRMPYRWLAMATYACTWATAAGHC